MFQIDLVNRSTHAIEVKAYATGFDAYETARHWAARYEHEFNRLGWTAVIERTEEADYIRMDRLPPA